MAAAGSNAWASASTINPTSDASDATPNGAFTDEVGEDTDYGYRSAWWKFTATGTGWTEVDTQLTVAGPELDTILSVWTGSSLAGLELLASNDDGGGSGTSLRRFAVVLGTTYYIRVGSYSPTGTMSYVLRATGIYYPPPAAEIVPIYLAVGDTDLAAGVLMDTGGALPDNETELPLLGDNDDDTYAEAPYSRDSSITYAASTVVRADFSPIGALEPVSLRMRFLTTDAPDVGGMDVPGFSVFVYGDEGAEQVGYFGRTEGVSISYTDAPDTIYDYSGDDWYWTQTSETVTLAEALRQGLQVRVGRSNFTADDPGDGEWTIRVYQLTLLVAIPSLTNPVIRKTHRRDSRGHMSAKRIGAEIPSNRIFGGYQ